MCEGIIAAAGKSQRTGGQYKMELDLNGKTLLQRSVESMLPFCSRIYVVGGFNIESLQQMLAAYSGVEILYNVNYEQGMFSSILEGIRHIRTNRFFFLPGDCPCVPHSVYQKMMEVDGEIVVPVYRGSPGHPILMRSSVIERLGKGAFSNLREFIALNNPSHLELGSPGILIDIDTIEDYQKALPWFKQA